jgi:glycosyltransferase involved in cell wall biosynthesis
LAGEPENSRRIEMSLTIQNHDDNRPTYAIVTAAYNEEKFIGKLLESVISQTVLPKKWVIVSDGSTDHTDEIVQKYADRYSFIELYRITEDHPRNLTAQVHAINAGFARLAGIDCEFIGNLDSDVSFEPTYFGSLLEKFSQNSKLGLAGGYIYEEKGGEFRGRSANTLSSVAHAVQLFRRECLEGLGGYKPFSWAGADTYAEVSLRMRGWSVQSVPELKAFHHRPTGNGFGSWRYRFRGGVMDFYLGTHPLFEIFRLARRLRGKPYVIGSLTRFAGFLWAYCSGAKREVSPEFVRFLREEQMQRLGLVWNGHTPDGDKEELSTASVGGDKLGETNAGSRTLGQ